MIHRSKDKYRHPESPGENHGLRRQARRREQNQFRARADAQVVLLDCSA